VHGFPEGHTFDDGPNECRRECQDSGNAFSDLIEAHARLPSFGFESHSLRQLHLNKHSLPARQHAKNFNKHRY